jgi:hypothetical protein
MSEVTLTTVNEREIWDNIESLEWLHAPQPSGRFYPVDHAVILHMARDAGTHILGPRGYSFCTPRIVTTRYGARMFATLQFKHPHSEQLQMAIGLRSSYDKSLSLGVAVGVHVIACSNMMFSGDIVTMRKHTSGVLQDFSNLVKLNLLDAPARFEQDLQTVDRLRAESCTHRDLFAIAGQALGDEVLPVTIINQIVRDVRKHRDEHSAINCLSRWDGFNMFAFHMKALPPCDIVPAHNWVLNQHLVGTA